MPRPCATIGTPLRALDALWYSSGNTAKHRRVDYEIHGSKADLRITEWNHYDDSVFATQGSYQLEDNKGGGLVVVDCQAAVGCWPGRGWGAPCH